MRIGEQSRIGRGVSGEAMLVVHGLDFDFVPACGRFPEQVHRQRVEELICDYQTVNPGREC